MTDKELAKEYVFTHYGDTDNDGNPLTDDIIMQRAFLAGLKAGRPQWHYPSKGDIPVESGEYLVIAESDHTLYTSLENYDPDDNEWSTCWKIVAWQHIDIPEDILEWTDDKEV